MQFFSSLFLISAVATDLVAAHSGHTFGRDATTHAHLHKRQAAGSVVVTGANGYGDNQIHSRLELSDIIANRPEQFNLLVLAMGEWQSQNANNMTSYYQVAGIHGVPRDSWDGVEACDSCGGADGYCTHVSILFPAWHRAYLALFEQEFLKVVVDIANRWTGSDRTTYLQAASTMRLPFWDWAAKADANSNVLPTLLSNPEVTVDGPNGRQTIANPFYDYQIPDDSAMYYQPFTTWQDTMRYPNTDASSATSDETSAVNAFNNIQSNMQQSIYSLLTNCKDYDHFSHDGATGSTSCSNSLEGIHNTIHTTAGGPGTSSVSGGHMTYLPLAAFDPIFWIHHANVDRIFALWQTINPNSYGGSQVALHNTWTIATGSTQDANSNLTPFRKDSSSFWTTNDVKDWANTFKYTYPEFASSTGSQSDIASYINALYGSSPTLTASSLSKRVENSSNSQQNAASSTAKRALSPTKAYGGGWGANSTIGGAYPTGTSSSNSSGSQYTNSQGGQYEYSCNVRTPRFAYNTSYVVYVFDGQPSTDDSTQYLADANCVGSLGILAGGSMTNSNIIVQGSVPLTTHLQGKVKEGCLESMTEQHVTPYLAQNLDWKIIRQGEEIQPDTLSGYKAAVYSGVSKSTGSNSLPQWSAWSPQVEATKGKAGGVQSEEEANNEWPVNTPSYGSGSDTGSGESSVTTVGVTLTATSECETSTGAISAPTYPASSYVTSSAESYPASSYATSSAEPYPASSYATSSAESYPASTPTPAPSYPASSPVESSPVQGSPSAPAYAPYPTNGPTPVNGTALPSGYAPSGYAPSYPSSSITPYTGAGLRVSGDGLLSIAFCLLAGMLLL